MDLGVAAREGTTGVASDVKEKEKSVKSSQLFCIWGWGMRREEMRKGRQLEIEICK